MIGTEELKDLMAHQVLERDRQELEFGDTLDIKTSIVLVVLTFLAGQAADSLRASPKGGAGIICQYMAIIALSLGGIFAVGELWPRNYKIEASPDRYDTWLSELKAHHQGEENSESKVVAASIGGRIAMAKDRIHYNIDVNKRKSWWMTVSFFCTAGAFALNLAALVSRLF
jgi:hypothetical protein